MCVFGRQQRVRTNDGGKGGAGGWAGRGRVTGDVAEAQGGAPVTLRRRRAAWSATMKPLEARSSGSPSL